jgi:hypothetical protein
MLKYKEVGFRLRAFIQTCNPSIQQVQGLLSDLLADDELLFPMRDVVARPIFISIRDLTGSGSGLVQREALLSEVGRTYLPTVVLNVGHLIDGILEKAQDDADLSANKSHSFAPPVTGIGTPNANSKWMGSGENEDPWGVSSTQRSSGQNVVDESTEKVNDYEPKRLNASQICDENLWNKARDPEVDKAFLKAWNLRWFNGKYRPRLERDQEA